jgi:hypothetical protein
MLTGLGHDTLVNSILFVAGVFPSHLHCWYLSCTYFHRRRKARKGKYPGGQRALIASKSVLNGGLSSAECERRWWAENGGKVEKGRISRRSSKRDSKRNSKRGSRQSSRRDAEKQVYPVRQGVDMAYSRPQGQRIQSWRSDIPVGHAGELSPALPPRPGVG